MTQSRLYNYFAMCWKNGTMTVDQVNAGVTKTPPLITQAECDTILAMPSPNAPAPTPAP